MDDGNYGDFIEVESSYDKLQTIYLIDGVEKGLYYRFKYRVQNQIGWSDESEVAYILAADAPSQPPAPTLISVSATDMVLQLYPPSDDGGSVITSYTLWMNKGAGYFAHSTYDGMTMTAAFNDVVDTLTAGNYYYF